MRFLGLMTKYFSESISGFIMKRRIVRENWYWPTIKKIAENRFRNLTAKADLLLELQLRADACCAEFGKDLLSCRDCFISARTPEQPQPDYIINNLDDLFNAAYQEFGLNQSQVLEKLRCRDKEDIPDAKDAWDQLKTIIRG